MISKLCGSCKKTVELSFFVKDRQRKDGLSYYCKDCTRNRQAIWKAKNPRRHKELERKHYLKKTYGLTVSEYNTLLKAQNNLCAICLNIETEKGKTLAVDHCHRTGKIRGLLCRKCNTSLAQFENTNSIHRAMEYLTYAEKNI